MTESIFDQECYRCGAMESAELIEDEQYVGLFICRSCLDKVKTHNEMIDRGLEEEPNVEA